MMALGCGLTLPPECDTTAALVTRWATVRSRRFSIAQWFPSTSKLRCYANLYLRNRRYRDLARLVEGNRAVGLEMLRSAGARTAVETARRLRLLPHERRDVRGQVVRRSRQLDDEHRTLARR
jgi:hypothetical protein